MTDLPRHPEASDADTAVTDQSSATRPWLVYVAAIVLATLLVLMIVLHLTGAVGPAAH